MVPTIFHRGLTHTTNDRFHIDKQEINDHRGIQIRSHELLRVPAHEKESDLATPDDARLEWSNIAVIVMSTSNNVTPQSSPQLQTEKETQEAPDNRQTKHKERTRSNQTKNKQQKNKAQKQNKQQAKQRRVGGAAVDLRERGLRNTRADYV